MTWFKGEQKEVKRQNILDFDSYFTLTEEQEKFLCLGLGPKQQARVRALQKLLKKDRKKAIKLFRDCTLCRGMSKKIAGMLIKMKLPRRERLRLMRLLAKIFRDFSKDLHTQLDLSEIPLNRLPIDLRNFLISLHAMKLEISHLERLRQEREAINRTLEYERGRNISPQISTRERNIGLELERGRMDKKIDSDYREKRAEIAISNMDYNRKRKDAFFTKNYPNNQRKENVNQQSISDKRTFYQAKSNKREY